MAEYWERFRGGPTRPVAERVHVTINAKGVITFNRNVRKMLGNAEAAFLSFNKADRLIGIERAHVEHDEAFPVVDRGNYWLINAAPFCRHFGIKVARTEKFTNPSLDPEGTLRLDLTTTVSAAVRPRKKGSNG